MQDTEVKLGDKKCQFKKQDPFMILFDSIHHDPVQWREPDRWVPERFDTRNRENEWALTSDGKPRNPLAFTPFMGGKRVCLGKTFAEVTVRFTIPLLYHFYEFDFVDEKQRSAPKEKYGIAGTDELKMPMKLTLKNQVR